VKAEQLEEVYKKFGAIKPGGVQVRMSRVRYSFAVFLLFEVQFCVHLDWHVSAF
jgi:hypothetical protein